MNDRTGWLANGITGKIHFFRVDGLSQQHRIALCGRKHHQYRVIQPDHNQSYCAICVKSAELEGISTPIHTEV